MTSHEHAQRLSQIETAWTMVFDAHQGEGDVVGSAQKQLLRRYGGAVYNYLERVLRDPDAAQELSQEFAVRFLRGDFHRVDPARGRFRDFVRRALSNLCMDYYRRKRTRPVPVSPEALEPVAAVEPELEQDAEFTRRWREGLMDRAWEELALLEGQTGQEFFTVLRYRTNNPQLTSAQLAQQLGQRLGRPLSAAGVRQTLHRAREKFAELLLQEVSRTLDEPTRERLEEELSDLGLLEYCRAALDRRGELPSN